MTTSNCIDCGLEVSDILLAEGRCADCNLDYKIEMRQLR